MKNYARTIHIKVPREEVFNAITNPLTIELWSGYPAEIKAEAGTEFSLFDGDISGLNRIVEPPKLLEQEWYFGDQPEESIVRIELFDEKGRTRLELEHIRIPDEAYENMATGWSEHYLGSLKSYLET